MEKKLLVVDTSYSYEDILKRNIVESVTCRDLDGFFSKVYTVHPLASLVTSKNWDINYGKAKMYTINEHHFFIEGKVQFFNWTRILFPINFLISQFVLFRQMERIIRDEKITMIRGGDVLYAGLFAILLKKRTKIPVMIRVGGNNDKVFESTGKPIMSRLFVSRKVEKWVERYVLKNADLIAGANIDNLNFALKNGANKEISTVFRYGNLLYSGHFVPPSERREGKSLLTEMNVSGDFLLYVGRLEKVKHPDHVIHALKYAIDHGQKQLKAILIGDGAMRVELEELAIQLGVQENVVLTGNKDQDWICRIIPYATVVVSPHTGRALSEVAYGAAPVVAYDIDWQSEIIINNETGLLVPYNDLEALNRAVHQLISNKDKRAHLGKSLRQKAIELLDPVMLNEHEKSEYTKLHKKHDRI